MLTPRSTRTDIALEYVDITQPITNSYDLIIQKVNDEISKESKDETIRQQISNLEVITIKST